MKIDKFTRLPSFLAFLMLLIFSCTHTKTFIDQPVYLKISMDSLESNLQKHASYEGINFLGVESHTNGDILKSIEINIINGKNLPSDNTLLDLGKEIAKELKSALKEPDAYHKFQVMFISQSQNGSLTVKKSNGKIFESEEL